MHAYVRTASARPDTVSVCVDRSCYAIITGDAVYERTYLRCDMTERVLEVSFNALPSTIAASLYLSYEA